MVYMDKPIIGWREWVALPELGVEHIKAKIDTGARTSALHAFDIEVTKKRGQDWARFTIQPHQKNDLDRDSNGVPAPSEIFESSPIPVDHRNAALSLKLNSQSERSHGPLK